MSNERTKAQLYREAKRLKIEGRSKMTKSALEAALATRGRSLDAILTDMNNDNTTQGAPELTAA